MGGLFELMAVMLFFVGMPMVVAFLDDFVTEWEWERSRSKFWRD